MLLRYILNKVDPQELEESGRAVLRKTRQQISEEIGMTVKTINRALTGFCENGWMSSLHGKITLNAEQYRTAQHEVKLLMRQSRNGAK